MSRTDSSHTHDSPAALIVGCGYLGRCLAGKLLDRGTLVWGTTRNPAHARELAAIGVRPLILDITQPVTLAALSPVLQATALNLFFLVPPYLTPRQAIFAGQTNLLRAIGYGSAESKGNLHRAILVSSTAVYGQADGSIVNADTPACPTEDRAKLLLESEKLWLSHGSSFHVLRLAGLYGPGRIVGLRSLRDQAPLVGNPQAWLNLIHVEDAAELLIAMAQSPAAGRIELGSDGSPTPRLAYYQHLAQRMKLPGPQVLGDEQAALQLGLNLGRLARTSSKACDPIPTMGRTGWSPRYRHYQAGLDQALM